MYTNTSILHFYFISRIFYKLIFSAVTIRAAIAITICFSQKQTVYSLLSARCHFYMVDIVLYCIFLGLFL